MKKNYLILVLMLLSAFLGKLQAQTDTDSQTAGYLKGQPNMAKAEPGTYQFFIIGEDSTQLLRTDLGEKIESYRDEYAVVHLKVSSTTTIRILPCSEITSTRFTPISNMVVFQPDQRDPVARR